MKWSENDELFFEEAKRGQHWQEYVGQRLTESGIRNEVQPLHLRDSIEQAHEYRNQEDIHVWSKSGIKLVIECKSRDLYFLSRPSTFPYTYIMVNTVSSWENTDKKPDFYICVSQRTGHMLVLPGDTKDLWETKDAKDGVREIYNTWFVCHKKHWCRYDEFIKALNES